MPNYTVFLHCTCIFCVFFYCLKWDQLFETAYIFKIVLEQVHQEQFVLIYDSFLFKNRV
jgi:hypothetical protein